MILAGISLFLAVMSSADALEILLNSKTSVAAEIYAEARKQIEREAACGNPLQQYVIGITTEDKGLAEKYLAATRPMIVDLAERRNNALAWYLLSVEKNDIDMLRRAARGGNVQALNSLGTISTASVLNGRNMSSNQVARILGESYSCFREAAKRKDPNGLINLGTCYSRGLGCAQDLTMAFACFRAAAEAGHPEGMDNVSACYQFGHGVKKDDEQCLLWAMRGRALRGDKAARKWLKEREERKNEDPDDR